RVFIGPRSKYSDTAVRFDAHSQFGANEVEAFGTHMAAQQAQARNANLRFGCTCDDRAIGIAHDDIADPHGRTPICGALDLGAADCDPLAAAEILLDGGDKPRAECIELNGPAG